MVHTTLPDCMPQQMWMKVGVLYLELTCWQVRDVLAYRYSHKSNWQHKSIWPTINVFLCRAKIPFLSRFTVILFGLEGLFYHDFLYYTMFFICIYVNWCDSIMSGFYTILLKDALKLPCIIHFIMFVT